MAKLRLIGAVGIKVRPDTTKFKEDTQRGVNRELGRDGSNVGAEVKVTVDADTTKFKRGAKKAKEEVEANEVTLKVGPDYESIKRTEAKIKQALKSLDAIDLPVTLDRPGLKRAQAELKRMAKDAEVHVEFIQDEAGYRSILNKIQRIRDEKRLTTEWRFKTDRASLAKAEREAKAGLAKIEANKTVEIRYSRSYTGIKGAIDDVDKRLEALRQLTLKTKLDKTSLETARQKLMKQMATAPVTLKFNEDKQGYEKVLSRIREIQREKAEVEVTFSTSDAMLEKQAKKYERLIKKIEDDAAKAAKIAPVTLEINEDLEGYQSALEHIKRIQREKLLKEITFATDPESLRIEMEKYQKLVEDLTPPRTIELNYHENRDGLEAAIKRIDDELRSLEAITVPVNADADSLHAMRTALMEELEGQPVEIKFHADKAGYQSVLAKIDDIRRRKLAKTITFDMSEESLNEEYAKYEALIRNHPGDTKIEFEYNENRDSLDAAIKRLDQELAKLHPIKLPVELNETALLAEKAKLQALLAATPITMKYHTDKAGYQSVLDKIKDLRREKLEKEITFGVNNADLDAAEKEIKEKLQKNIQEVAIKYRAAIEAKDLEEAKHQAEQLKDHIDHMKASMQMEVAGAELTSARLNFVGRDRVVNYIAKVNTRSIAVAEGMLKSLGGLNVFSSVGSMLEGIFTKFDTYSIKATAVAAALGNVVNILAYAGTAAFKVGEGVFQSLGLLAAAPGILGAATVGYTIFTAAFNNFFDAFNKDPKIAASSLAALPPLARKTVDSITGLYKGLANPIQEKFWAHVGTTLSDSIETLYPKLKDSLLNSTEAVGDFVAGIGKSMNKLALSDDFDRMFAGFNGFFVNLSKGSEPFFDAWNKFGVSGAQLLPQFGDWLAKLAIRFDNWATTLGEAGISDMIMHGVESLQNMWNVGADVIDMFKGLTKAAGLAGTGGLAQLEINLRKVADRMNSEPWQSKASVIFEGARKGASNLNEGVKDLTKTFGNSSVWLGTVLTQLGDIGGQSFTLLSDLFGSQRYQSGVTAELTGMQTLMDSLRPSAKAVGDIIGDMGKVAGSVFSSLGPVVNQLTTMISNATQTLSDNLAAVAPKLLATVGGVLRVMAPLVEGAAGALNGLLDIAKQIPNSFVVMGVAATAFFAMRGLASKFFDSFRQTGVFKNLESNWLTQQVAAGKTVDKLRLVNGEMQKFTVPTQKFSATAAGYDAITSGTGKLRTQFQDLNGVMQRMDGTTAFSDKLRNLGTVAAPGAKKALGGLMDFIGGGWGLTFMAAAAVLGIFAQGQADSKQHVEALTAAIDKQTGAMNKSGLEEIAKRWTDLGEAQDGWANANRGTTKAANETFDKLGQSIPEATVLISKGGAAAQEYADKWKALGKAVGALELGGMNADMDVTRSTADAAAKALGMSVDEIKAAGVSGADLTHVAQNMNDEIARVNTSRLVFEGLAKATGETTIAAEQMAGAMQTIGDNSLTAAGKIGAINKALDLLKGGKLTAREAEAAAQSAQQQAVQQAQALHDELAGNQHLFDATTKMLDLGSTSGLKLWQTMQTASDGIKIAAQSAADTAKAQGKSVSDQAAAAQAVVDGNGAKLEEIAKAAGVSKDKIAADWSAFFGTKWELGATFTANADKFQAVRKGVEESGLKWDETTFQAFLDANKDPATVSVLSAEEWGRRWATAQYKATLDALNQPALMNILATIGQADNYKNGNYQAVMTALNSTDPGIQAAIAGLWAAQTNGGKGWDAAIKAYADAVAAANTKALLDDLAKLRTVRFVADASDVQQASDRIKVNGGSYLNGGILNGRLVKTFANGGFENHVAQISRPMAGTVRIWGEEETGGEAYIPLSAAKRQRSTQILNQVASQFGMKLSSATSYANGGISGGSSAGMHVHIDAQPGLSYQYAQEVAYAAETRFRDAQVLYNILH